MPTTLIDIARETNTSVSTVSRVLAGGTVAQRISEETRARVLAAAKRLGYRPNLLARSLRTRRSNTVALLLSDIANPFFALVCSLLEQYLYPHGYSLLVCNSGDAGQREVEYLEMLPRKGIDGLICVPLADTKEHLASHFPADIPLVVIDRPIDGINSSVTSDQEQGARLLCEAMQSVGAKRVGLITGPESVMTHRLRCRAVERYFKVIARREGPVTMQTGEQAFEEFKSHRIDAIIGTNATMAQGYLKAMTGPDDRLIVGTFDQIHVKNLITMPVVCAIQDLPGMAAGAVKQLLPQLRREPFNPEPILLPMRLEANQAFHDRAETSKQPAVA